jgi:hypothetical protein
MAQVKFLKIASNVPAEHAAASDDLTVLSLSTDTVLEQTPGNGVAIDGVTLKDSGATFGADIVMGDFSITGVDTIAFTDVAGTIAGIQNQNLLDKTASASITGDYDFGGAASLEIPNGGTPTVDVAGEIAVDTTITDHTGLITYHDGVEALFVIALPTGNLSSVDGAVIAYNATNNEFEMVAQGGTDYSQETYTNGNAGAIALGDVVYMTGTNDTVDLADADTIAQGSVIVGLVADASIASTGSGSIHTQRGRILAGILTAATAGTVYYLSATGTTGNTLTTTGPSGGPALVKIGFAKNATDLVFEPEFIADTTA